MRVYTRKRGQWLGGRTPFGYRKNNETRKLTIDSEEAETVRRIFDLCLQGHSTLAITQALNGEGHLTKAFVTRTGRVIGNKPFVKSRITYILKNYIYAGKVLYEGKEYGGQQPAIISEETLFKARRMLAENKIIRIPAGNKKFVGLLSQLLFCQHCGTPMIHTYATKGTKHKYRYYVCTNAQKRGYIVCPNKSIPAQIIEDEMVTRLKEFVAANKEKLPASATEVEALLSPIWDSIFPREKRRIIDRIVKRIDCNVPDKRLGFTFHDIPERMEFDSSIRRGAYRGTWRKERTIEKEPKLRRTLILAYHLQQHLDNGMITSKENASKYLLSSLTRINHVLNMLMLSPAIQEEIVFGDTVILDRIPEYKLRELSFKIDWNEQARLWQEAKNA